MTEKMVRMVSEDKDSGMVRLMVATGPANALVIGGMDFVAVPKLLDALEKHAVRLGKTGYIERENWQMLLAELLDAPSFEDRKDI